MQFAQMCRPSGRVNIPLETSYHLTKKNLTQVKDLILYFM